MYKLICSALASSLVLSAHAENLYQEVIVVTAQKPEAETTSIYTEDSKPSAVDGVAMIARLPGAAMISNGSLSGQVQYRGTYGFRVGQQVNGQSFRSGGPNLMDPPMHYAPITLVDSFEVARGVAGLSFGPSLSGGVNANLKQVGFSHSASWQSEYDITLLGRSADDSYGLGLSGGLATDSTRLYGFYSSEEGDDQKAPEGEITNTFHERSLYGAGFGKRWDDTEVEFEMRRHETEPTGNPPFAMDIDYVDSDFVQGKLTTVLGQTQMSLSLGYSDVEHGMNNFAHRPAPTNPMRFRQNNTSAKSLSARLDFNQPLANGSLDYGFDVERHEHEGLISNPNNGNFFVTQLPDITQDRVGAYVNWQGHFGPGQLEAGIRADQYDDDAATALVGPALPAMPGMLAMNFNNADRSWSDTAIDGLVRYAIDSRYGTWRTSLARKHRAPVYLERYAWLPTAASSGLADGNNYVGSLDLDIETTWVAEIGLDMQFGSIWLSPSIYAQRINDYVQGVPVDASPSVVDSAVEMVSNANGDATPLRFANVDAKIYGFDASYGWQLNETWRLEGVATLVRGERRDINDDLYRISPDKLTLSVIYQPSNWMLALEVEGVRKQSRVSNSNSEQATSGYGLLNLFGSWQASRHLQVSGGIDNLTDKDYALHLAGYNRISNSDVALGERLPGVGRNVFLRLSYQH